jgi:predicted dehydrogenase
MKKICLVGCGGIGRLHAKNLSPLAQVFFYSRSRSSAARFQDEFQGGGIFDDFEAVLKEPQIEALVLASPPQYHKEQTVAALQAGKSVLVEKPMCVNAAELDAIQQALEAHPDLFVMVAENYYYKPSLALLKQLLAQGWIGALKWVAAKKVFTQEASGWKSHYGALLEGGVHFVALLSDLFDAAPVRVAAEFPGLQPGQPERHSITRLHYPGGTVAKLEYSWNTRSLTKGVFQHSYICGENGSITFESNGIYVWLNSKKKKRLYLPDCGDLMGYHGMSRDFIDCLRDSCRTPYSDFYKARRDLQIIFAAYNTQES